MEGFATVLYYAFGPFVLLAFAALPCVYAACIGAALAVRRGRSTILHIALLAGLTLAVSPIPPIALDAGSASGSWPFPAFLDLLSQIDRPARAPSRLHAQAYWGHAACIALAASGVLLLSWGVATALRKHHSRRVP